MTENPWANQPDVGPYEDVSGRPMDSLAQFIRMADGRHEIGAGELAERIAVEWLPDRLAEAERRGVEKGWDEAHAAHDMAPDEWINPYRKEAR